jgi:hypothetical protein
MILVLWQRRLLVLRAISARNLGKDFTITCSRFFLRTLLEQLEQCLKLVWAVMVRWIAMMEQPSLRMSMVGFLRFGQL